MLYWNHTSAWVFSFKCAAKDERWLFLHKWFYNFQPLVTFVKVSILDVWPSSECAPEPEHKGLCLFVMLEKYCQFLSRIINNLVKAFYGRLSYNISWNIPNPWEGFPYSKKLPFFPISGGIKREHWLVPVITCLRGKFGINLPSSLFWNFEISQEKRGRFQNFKKKNEVNFPQISRINMWFLVNHMW